MSDGPSAPGPLDELRVAARGPQEHFLIGVPDTGERARLVAGLTGEGGMVELPSAADALRRLGAEPADLVVLEAAGATHMAFASREIRPYTDVIALIAGDADECGQLYAHEVAAVLPRPLPEADALLRAHLRWLASCRRMQTRGRIILNAFSRTREALQKEHAALVTAIAALQHEADLEPTILAPDDAELERIAGGRPPDAGAPDLVVLGLRACDDMGERLRAARDQAAGVALMIVDAAPTPERMAEALYGGARAYLPRSHVADIGRTAAFAAQRRRVETVGRKLAEALARFGVLRGPQRPAAPAVHQDIAPDMLSESLTQSAGPVVPTGHEVLVVDDEAVVLTVLREALRRGGYRVTTAASAEEAIDLMRRRRFDLVLTDKNLPGASGLEVLRAAQALNPAPAIVLITGYSSYDSAYEAMNIGAHDYLEKPIRNVEDLRFRIRRALSRRDEQLARTREAPSPDSATILVVEVDDARRQLLLDYLGRTYKVRGARDGDEALELLKQERYALVLADRNLPGVSGLRVIEQARRLLPHCASVLYTAYPSYESVKDAFAMGVDAYLVRPSEDLQKLGTKVAEALRGRGGILLG